MEPKKLQWKWADTFGIAFVVLAMLLMSDCQGATSTTTATTVTTLATTTVTATGKIDVLTYHYDNLRDGVDSDETILTPQNVNANSFGKLFNVSVDYQATLRNIVFQIYTDFHYDCFKVNIGIDVALQKGI
jgi:hypothetical protein